MPFTADNRRAQDSLILANDFDGFIEFEDKTFESMLESLPLDGRHGVIFTNLLRKSLLLCNLQLTRDSVSMVAFCVPGEDNIASFPAS